MYKIGFCTYDDMNVQSIIAYTYECIRNWAILV